MPSKDQLNPVNKFNGDIQIVPTGEEYNVRFG